MKKIALLACGVALSACDSGTTNMETFCLNSAKDEGKAITTQMKAHCKCVQKQMMIAFGAEKTEALAKFLSIAETKGAEAAVKATEKYKFSLKPVKDGFVQISIQCAAQSGLVD